MDDLLREAIADAKAVRETALENAKIALEEAFTPRLQSMLSKKIATEMEDAEKEDSEEMNREMAEDDEEEMIDKVDAEERDDSDMGAEEMKMDADEMEDEAPEEGEEIEIEDEEDEAPEEGEEVGIEDEEAEIDDMREEEEDDLDLESVLAELEADLNDEEEKDGVDESEESDKDKEETVDENDVSSDIGKSDNKVNPKANDSSATGAQGPEGEGKDEPAGNELDDHEVVKEEEEMDDEKDIDLDEVLRALSEEEDAEDEADKVEELKKEITETRNVVKFMRAKLNEVNLLNAKLLFSNKLFRAFGLNNNQKLKVVENFDRTKNLREVKLVYATLAESFKKPSKLSESVVKGSSSKPVASTKPAKEQVLSEGSELKARFKKLANIL
jgi:hypothetical protein